MKLKSLQRITKSLRDVFVELKHCGLQDRDVRHRYAEFFVASELCKRGHTVQLLGDREVKSADIYLPDNKKKRVEVKSGKCDEENWAGASFGLGDQISANKFDYCVFVTFNYDDETIKDTLVFTKEELQEITKIRKGVARYESTNRCLFMYAPNIKELDDWTKENKKTKLSKSRGMFTGIQRDSRGV